MFLLLIFFLVATTLKKVQKELPIELPQADAAVEAPEDPKQVVLGVDKYGQFYVDGNEADRSAVRQAIRKGKTASAPFRIDADVSTPYIKVVELVNLCKWEDVTDVKLHTRKDKDKR
jgi:biopolymer transport protein ExbD